MLARWNVTEQFPGFEGNMSPKECYIPWACTKFHLCSLDSHFYSVVTTQRDSRRRLQEEVDYLREELSKNVRLVEKQQQQLQSLEQAAKKPRLPQAPTSSSADEPSQETEWHGNKAKVKTLGPRPCKDSYESVPVKEEPVEEPGRASNDPGMAKPAEPPEAGEQQPSGSLRQPMVTQEHGDVSSYLKTGCLVLLLNCFLPFFF